MNKCIFVARLTRDPEVRYSQGDNATCIASFSGAVDRRFNNQEQSADFLNFKAFGKIGEFVERYAKKGMKFIIEARVQTGSYTNKDGVKVYTTDFVIENMEFAESKKSDSDNKPSQRVSGNDGFMDIPDGIDEQLPFN